MNQETAALLFHRFFKSHLAPRGFALRTPWLAERTSAGLRQGVMYRFSEYAGYKSFGCNAFWSFTHELDDAPPFAPLGKYEQPVNGGSTAFIEAFDVRSEQAIEKRLRELLESDLALLDDLRSIERILDNVERYPASATKFLGQSAAESFNHAFCLEQVGRETEAKARYLAMARETTADNSEIAARFRDAAWTRANALTSTSLDIRSDNESPGGTIASASGNELKHEPAGSETLESRLAREALPLDMHPHYLLPRDVANAIEQANAPSIAFWCDIDAGKMVEELGRAGLFTEDAIFRDDVINEIQTRQFDEFCAKWLLTLPEDAVRAAPEDVYEMLETYLEENAETMYLHYLELDGVKAIPHLLKSMRRLRACPV